MFISSMAEIDEQRAALGRAVRERRAVLACSRREAAHRWGVSAAWLARLERGEANPTLDRLIELSAAMGVSLSELLARAEEISERRSGRPAPPARPR